MCIRDRLKHAPVGPAFAASHLNVVSVLILSAWLLHERLSLPELGGAVLIVLGILMLASAEQHDGHAPGDA
jgi:drug/metabolite transporter (DMT)-like permease